MSCRITSLRSNPNEIGKCIIWIYWKVQHDGNKIVRLTYGIYPILGSVRLLLKYSWLIHQELIVADVMQYKALSLCIIKTRELWMDGFGVSFNPRSQRNLGTGTNATKRLWTHDWNHAKTRFVLILNLKAAGMTVAKYCFVSIITFHVRTSTFLSKDLRNSL